MEWCRMNTLRVIMCVVLLCCKLQCVVPDSMPERQTMTERERKIQELYRSLDAYATELGAKSSPTESSTTSTTSNPPTLSIPSLVKFPTMPPFYNINHQEATRSRSGTDLDSKVIHEVKDLPGNPKIRDYDDFYRVIYGTPEGVNLLRKQYGPNGLQKARANYGVQRSINDLKAANDHYRRVHDRTRCRKPVPQIIKVKDYYPDPSKQYLPSCTLLHRCGDDTGCCSLPTDHCAPSAFQEVTLHFYVLKLEKHGFSSPNRNAIEKLLFVNHTACRCLPINDLPRLQDGRELPDTEETTSKSKCGECPVPFTSRVYKDGRCGCDCFDKQRPCIRIKRGREPLPEIERKCVEANHCHIPDCEYGLYDTRTGFCPRRHDEDQRGPHRRPHQVSANQRWAFKERD